jgi:hypothetical protein
MDSNLKQYDNSTSERMYALLRRVALRARTSPDAPLDEVILAECEPASTYADNVLLIIDLGDCWAYGATKEHSVELISRETWMEFNRRVVARDLGFAVRIDDFRDDLYRWSELQAPEYKRGRVVVLYGDQDATKIAAIYAVEKSADKGYVDEAIQGTCGDTDDDDDDDEESSGDERPLPPAKRVAK